MSGSEGVPWWRSLLKTQRVHVAGVRESGAAARGSHRQVQLVQERAVARVPFERLEEWVALDGPEEDVLAGVGLVEPEEGLVLVAGECVGLGNAHGHVCRVLCLEAG